jgi:GAF domain-containing protein
MPLLLLISAKDTLSETLSTMLPVSTSLQHLATVAEAKAYLRAPASKHSGQTLILLDAGDGQEMTSACRQLREDDLASDIPIIVIVANPADRQTAIEAGADDYLLLPLLPSEVNARLIIHSVYRGFNTLIEAIDHLQREASPVHALDQAIRSLAEQFNAPSAWLFLLDPGREEIRLVGSYNLPPILRLGDTIRADEVLACLQLLDQGEPNFPQVIPCPYLAKGDRQVTNGLTHHLSIPLSSGQRLVGVLNLAYIAPPKIPQAEKRMLAVLGRNIGVLLDMALRQEEMQVYAAQTGFMVLVARLVSEPLDLNTILSLTLEQATALVNASSGEIWLLSADRQWLKLASSLNSSLFSDCCPNRIAVGQGLRGWVAKHGKALNLSAPVKDPRFNPQLDQLENMTEYSLLAVPLHHRETTIGVLAVHNVPPQPFTNRDAVLLEGISNLSTSAIANAQMVQELRTYADQQRALYEMSQQIAAGLDLRATLDRALHWIGRLFDTEFGLLWLVDGSQDQDTLHLVATLGIDLPQGQQIAIPSGKGLVGWIARNGEATMVNDPANDPRFDHSISHMLNIMPRNIVSVPIIYRDQTIGVLSLLNKLTGPFDETDVTLLSTAVDMVAVAVGNARLHTRTLALMEEHKHLHKQILQSERLATIGRLTATLSHEINNPMQAIRGALALAIEELDDPQEVAAYIRLSIQESERVVHLISRMRQIYRPQSDAPETIDLNQVLQEAITIARKELKQQNITIHAKYATELPAVIAIANQLHLVFLSFILNLSDLIGAAGGGELHLRTLALPEAVRVEFFTDLSVETVADLVRVFKPGTTQAEIGTAFSSSLSYDIITTHGGAMDLYQRGQQSVLGIQLPLLPPDLSVPPKRIA